MRKLTFWAAMLRTDDKQEYSLTKFWTNVAYSVTTAVVVWQAFHHELTAETIGLYLGIVAGHGLGNMYLKGREYTAIKDEEEVTK
jgi:hypothetical protein